MKKILAAVAAVLLAGGLAACGSDTSSPPDSLHTQAAQAADEQAYLAALHTDPWFNGVDDGTLLDAGNSVCGALDRGASFYEVASAGAGSGVPDYQRGEVIGAAVSALCPEYLPQMEKFLGEVSA